MTNFVYMKMKVGPINNSAFSSLSSSRLYSLPKYITKPFYKMCVFEVVWWNASHLLYHMHMLKSFATSIQNNYDGFVFIPSFSDYGPSLNRPLSLVLFWTPQKKLRLYCKIIITEKCGETKCLFWTFLQNFKSILRASNVLSFYI